MSEIAIDAKNRETLIRLVSQRDLANSQINLIASTLINVVGEQADETWQIAPDFSKLVKPDVPKPE